MSAEDVAELAEYVVHRAAPLRSASSSAVHASVSELVVALTFVGIAQHLVSLSRLLELLLCLFVARVLVRVVLYGFLSVSLLYLIGTGGLAYPQHFIIISFFHKNTSCV